MVLRDLTLTLSLWADIRVLYRATEEVVLRERFALVTSAGGLGDRDTTPAPTTTATSTLAEPQWKTDE